MRLEKYKCDFADARHLEFILFYFHWTNIWKINIAVNWNPFWHFNWIFTGIWYQRPHIELCISGTVFDWNFKLELNYCDDFLGIWIICVFFERKFKVIFNEANFPKMKKLLPTNNLISLEQINSRNQKHILTNEAFPQLSHHSNIRFKP